MPPPASSLEFDEPAAAVIKHTNPCGVATGATIAEAYVRAREADALAAFGGIIGLNRTLDEETARAIVSTFIEAVVAPGVDDAARTILAAKANLRVVVADFRTLADTREYRSILGAMLVQERDRVIEAHAAVADRGDQGRDQASADRRRVAGDALCLARDGARQVEHRDLHRRGAHAGDRRGADEPRRCREGRRQQGRRLEGRRVRRRSRDRSRHRMRSSRSATGSMPSPLRARPRSCSLADR